MELSRNSSKFSTPVDGYYLKENRGVQKEFIYDSRTSLEDDDLFSEDSQLQYATLQQQQHPKDPRTDAKCNIISRLFFFWLDPLLFLGSRRELQQEDLYTHPMEADSGQLLARFNWYWKKEVRRKLGGLPTRLWMVLAQCIWWRLILQGFLIAIEAGIVLVQSVILGFLAEYFSIQQPTGTDTRNAYLLALGLVSLSVVLAVMHSHSFLLGQKMSMMLKVISTGAIYKKVLSLSQVSLGQISVGHVINLASNDVQRFDPVFPHFPYMWVSPLHLVVFTYLAYQEVGWAAFLATGFVVLQVPLQIMFARLFVHLRFESASITDKRIHTMNEVITGIRVIKMYAWEHAFKNVVSTLRKQESNFVFKGAIIRACNLAYMIVSTSMIMWLVLTVHTSLGGELSTRQVFTLLSLLTTLRLSFHFFVLALLGFSEGRVAMQRIQHFLDQDDVASLGMDTADLPSSKKGSKNSATVYPAPTIQHTANKVKVSSNCYADSIFIKVENLSASWSHNPTKLVLQNIHFELNESIPLLAVIGPVGSGKSSLLQCLLGELQALQGSVRVQGSVSYVSQDPWVFAGTLRDNILFGETFDQIWYEKVLEACSLDKDLQDLPQRDFTMVGERGVTLSGGQKARVSLARAIYRDSEVYLLDDPLSALDVNVAMHIYDNCIRGLLDSRVVVMVTHQIQFALPADKILLIKEGHQEVYSSNEELMAKGIDPAYLMGLIQDDDDDEEDEYGRNMFNYKNIYDPPSPTTVSMLSADPINEDGHITPFSFVSDSHFEDNLGKSSPSITPLAMFSKSMRDLHLGKSSPSTMFNKPMRDKAKSFIFPVPEIVETASITSTISEDQSPNPDTARCNGGLTSTKNVKDHWPLAETTDTGELMVADVHMNSDAVKESFADDPPSLLVSANCESLPNTLQLKSPGVTPRAWPFAPVSPTSPYANSKVPRPLNLQPHPLAVSPTDGAWPFANKLPSSPPPSFQLLSSKFSGPKAWPFANKPLNHLHSNFPRVHEGTPSSLSTISAKPLNSSLPLPQPQRNQESKHTEVVVQDQPTLSLLPPTPPLLHQRPKIPKKLQIPSQLSLSSSSTAAGGAKSPQLSPRQHLSPLASLGMHDQFFGALHSEGAAPTSPAHSKRASPVLSLRSPPAFTPRASPISSPGRSRKTPLISPVASQMTPPASPAHGQKTPHSSPLISQRSLLSSPVPNRGTPLGSPTHGQKTPLSSPVPRRGTPLSSPAHGQKTPLRSPLINHKQKTLLSSPVPSRSTPAHGSRNPLITSPRRPAYSKLSPFASPIMSRRGLIGSPVNTRAASACEELHTVSLDPGRLDAASIYSVRSIASLGSYVARELAANQANDQQTPCENDSIYEEPLNQNRRQDTVSLKTYCRFFKAGGSFLLLATVLLIFILGEAGIIVSDWWLSDWANCFSVMGSGGNSTCAERNSTRVAVYTATTFTATVLSFSRAILFCFICVNASRVLHSHMFEALLHAKVLFFDTNPVGRILNRFSKDIGILDDLLPYHFCEFILLSLRCLAVVVTAVASNVWLILPALGVIMTFVLLRWYYLKAARDVKRLEAIARSPVYSHLSTTLQGLSTIRSYQREDMALRKLHNVQNQHTQGWYLYLVMIRWFGMRIDFLSVVFLAAVAFISIPLASELNAGLVGLSLTYAVSLADVLQYTIRLSAEVENTMVSAERVMEYNKLESECSFPDTVEQSPPNWPLEGEIKLEDVNFQYSLNGQMVLKNLNFTVKKSEKVGIVGRTGAGKSSLISVLYRLAEPYGQITIDGVDTKTIGLQDLRKKMSIIPQDPVLFSGSMRYNLDPFDEYSDAQLWEVLEQVQLKAAVKEIEGQLSGEVTEGGSNFSVGQRQLVCLARALLRKNKILILDEATANVDPRTDGIIQKAIHEAFSDCTTLVIAHRLDTIMDADKIIVLKNGKIKEFDSPYKLLQNPNSKFYLMVEKTGLTASGRLHQMALESHLRRRFKQNGRITPAQAKGSVKKMSFLFAQSLLHRSTGSGPFGLSRLQERRASILSSNSFPRALNEVGMGGPSIINANDPNLQSLRLPSDPNMQGHEHIN